MSTINVNSTYAISGQTLKDICDAIKGVTGQSSVQVSQIANTIQTMNKLPLVQISPASSVTIQPYRLYDFGVANISMMITLGTTGIIDGYSVEYQFRFTAGVSTQITLPSGIKLVGGEQPTLQAGHVYEYSIVDNVCAIGEFY